MFFRRHREKKKAEEQRKEEEARYRRTPTLMPRTIASSRRSPGPESSAGRTLEEEWKGIGQWR